MDSKDLDGSGCSFDDIWKNLILVCWHSRMFRYLKPGSVTTGKIQRGELFHHLILRHWIITFRCYRAGKFKPSVSQSQGVWLILCHRWSQSISGFRSFAVEFSSSSSVASQIMRFFESCSDAYFFAEDIMIMLGSVSVYGSEVRKFFF